MNPETLDTGCCEAPEKPAGQCMPSAGSLILLVPRLVVASLRSATEVISKTLDGSLNNKYCEDPCHDKCAPGCCDIPETSCPSPCVGEICWSGCVGDRFRYRLQVTNTGDTEREFRFSAVPFPCTDQQVTLSADRRALAPGESFLLEVGFAVPDEFGGGVYCGRLSITGTYEQFLRILLNVHPHQACCGHVEQGEIPQQIKAKHWFRHFQYEKPCFPAAPEARQP